MKDRKGETGDGSYSPVRRGSSEAREREESVHTYTQTGEQRGWAWRVERGGGGGRRKIMEEGGEGRRGEVRSRTLVREERGDDQVQTHIRFFDF